MYDEQGLIHVVGGFRPPPLPEKNIIFFSGFLMNWLQTEAQTVPNMP